MSQRFSEESALWPVPPTPGPEPSSPELCEEGWSRHAPGTGGSGSDVPPCRIPPSREMRERCLQAVRAHVEAFHPVPPLSLESLSRQAVRIAVEQGIPGAFHDFLTVLLGNAVWRDSFSAIPFHRRLLLLPQCLRDKDRCPASGDALGLLCEHCGQCSIGRVLPVAEELGYVTLVAEGTTVVMQLLEKHLVDAVLGVGCLSSLERLFPHTISAAIPCLAFPLVRDGCNDTRVDEEWLLEEIRRLTPETGEGILDLEALKKEVQTWFEEPGLAALLQPGATRTERIACEWMRTGGKRWRPFLAASAFVAVRGGGRLLPESLRKLAVAVECFHKASLAHDDIEDGDDDRYGKPTLHLRHGMPVALNAGDLLVGEGYRLIAECGEPPAVVARLMAVAARGHRDLCLGQGEELLGSPGGPTQELAQVLEIFRHKTAPAFEVALALGAISGGADEATVQVLHRFSTALGIAYQIRDDLEDYADDSNRGDRAAGRLSILPALTRDLLAQEGTFSRADREPELPPDLLTRAEEEARKLLAWYRQEAIRALEPLRSSLLKRFLFQVTHRMLGTVAESARPTPPAVQGMERTMQPPQTEEGTHGYLQ